MKGSARALISIVIFLGILSLITTGLISSRQNVGISITGDNLTDISAIGSTPPPVFNICQLQGSDNSVINALQSFVNVIPGVNCITGFFTYLYGYSTIDTGIGFLAIIITALILALIYIGLGLLRGGK